MGDVVKKIESIVEYKDLLTTFGREKIISRYEFIRDFILCYIKSREGQNSLILCDSIIDHVVIDYFVDVMRLKPFQEIEFINETKIYGYMAYWLLRHKPIQIIKEADAEKFTFINEEMVTAFLLSYLFDNSDVVLHSKNEQQQVDEFVELLLYFFKYRHYTAQSIEFMLVGFNAGRAYQTAVDFRK